MNARSYLRPPKSTGPKLQFEIVGPKVSHELLETQKYPYTKLERWIFYKIIFRVVSVSYQSQVLIIGLSFVPNKHARICNVRNHSLSSGVLLNLIPPKNILCLNSLTTDTRIHQRNSDKIQSHLNTSFGKIPCPAVCHERLSKKVKIPVMICF